MRRGYSRLETVEEKRNTRRAILFGLIAILILVFLAFYGIPITTKLIGIATSFKKSPSATVKDLTPPAPPTFSSLPDTTNKTPLGVSGHTETGNTVVISFNGNETEYQTDENGNFSENFDLTKGTNTFYAYAKDASGNKSQQTSSYIVIYDNTPETLTISTPNDGSSYYGANQQNIGINGSTKVDSTVTINDRIIPVNDDGTFSYSYFLSIGENDLTIKATDKAGNEKDTSLKLNFSQ